MKNLVRAIAMVLALAMGTNGCSAATMKRNAVVVGGVSLGVVACILSFGGCAGAIAKTLVDKKARPSPPAKEDAVPLPPPADPETGVPGKEDAE